MKNWIKKYALELQLIVAILLAVAFALFVIVQVAHLAHA